MAAWKYSTCYKDSWDQLRHFFKNISHYLNATQSLFFFFEEQYQVVRVSFGEVITIKIRSKIGWLETMYGLVESRFRR